MPEVAEIALTAEILSKYLIGSKLESVDFIAGRYTKKLPDGYDDFEAELPMKITSVDSVGKFLWFELKAKKNTWYIWNTFGLTGMWSLFEPKHLRIKFNLSDNIAYFSDMRNFGTMKFSTDKKALDKKIADLSPDLLKSKDFDIDIVLQYKKKLVKILMDQKIIGSGIGNYLAAEILYRAKLSPHRLGSSLTESELAKLKYAIKYTIKLAYVDNHIGYMINLEDEANNMKRKNYHSDIKLKSKDFEFKVYGQKTDPKGNPVKTDKIVDGRTTYWVPAVQV